MAGSDDCSALPGTTIHVLKARAALLQSARAFFLSRGYWEAETPILSSETVIDAHIDPVSLLLDGQLRFLQTSPELAMKRLLAAGSGSIFQFAHAVRSSESGRRHNREFQLLEWYHVGASLADLMAEVVDLVQLFLPVRDVQTLRYRDAFRRSTGLDPLRAPEEALFARAKSLGLAFTPAHRDDLLNFLWAAEVEPTFSKDVLVFIHDYPASQAALAQLRIDEEGDAVAERFELFVAGIEIANGYHELRDANELRQRFHEQNARREKLHKPRLPIPEQLLTALTLGLPDCSGVAVGFDRLSALALGADSILDVIPFADDRA